MGRGLREVAGFGTFIPAYDPWVVLQERPSGYEPDEAVISTYDP